MVDPDLIVPRTILFGSALEGGFRVPTDPTSIHRLSLLAHTVVEKGVNTENDDNQRIFELNPEWAPTALASVVCEVNYCGDEPHYNSDLHLVNSVILKSLDDTHPDVAVHYAGLSGLALLIGDNERLFTLETRYPLKQGAPLDLAKRHVTEAARSFFRSLVPIPSRNAR